MTPDILRGYSNPFEPFDEGLHRGWMAAVQAARLRAFVGRWDRELESRGRGLRNALERFAERCEHDGAAPQLFETLWHPFSNLTGLSPAEDVLVEAAGARALQWALRVAEGGSAVDCEASVSRPIRLGFAHLLLPAATRFVVEGDGESCTLRLLMADGWSVEELRRTSGAWHHLAGRAEALPSVDCGERRIVVGPFSRWSLSPDDEVIAATPAMISTLQAALHLIIERSPTYRAWIERLLRVVVPLRPVSGKDTSETYPTVNGAVYLSIRDDVTTTAETLVHEISHEYLHAAQTMEPLAEPLGAEVFYSPPRRMDRPVVGILKAQHAFGNVLLFHHLLRLAGAPLDEACARNVEELEAWRAHFEACLGRSTTLTAAGHEIWRPLARRVHQIQALTALARESAPQITPAGE